MIVNVEKNQLENALKSIEYYKDKLLKEPLNEEVKEQLSLCRTLRNLLEDEDIQIVQCSDTRIKIIDGWRF